jgi:probable poly-beta-1,6-N-acetyl-D-glucosamine export protein
MIKIENSNIRNPNFDFFRGISIICVIIIHSLTQSKMDVLPYTDWKLWFGLFLRQIVDFAVPSFLFISGFLLSKHDIKNFKEYKSFISTRVAKIGVPYIIWSFLSILLFMLLGNKYTPTEIFFEILTGSAQPAYYFIFVLFIFYLIFPLLYYFNKNFGKIGFLVIILLNLLTIIFLKYFFTYYGYYLPFPLYALVPSTWILFFYMGIFFKSNNYEKALNSNINIVYLFVLLFLAFSMLESYEIYALTGIFDFASSPVKISSFLYSISIVILLYFFRNKHIGLPDFLISIGRFSFGIYLIHMFIMRFISIVIAKYVYYNFNPIFLFIFLVLSTSLLSFAILVFMNMLSIKYPKLRFEYVFGFSKDLGNRLKVKTHQIKTSN